MFQWFDILLVTGFCLGFCQYHVTERRTLLMIRTGVLFFFCSYFYFYGAYAGAIVSGVSLTAVIMQIILPVGKSRRAYILRNVAAGLFAVIGVGISYQGNADILPLIGFVAARFAEAQTCLQRMRSGMLVSIICWTIYAFNQEIWLVVMTDSCLLVSNLYAIWRFRRAHKNTVKPLAAEGL